ncbi:MAG TPA: tail fiber protein [Polyangia bacterium]|nr:tail fiber protein [Polyangia bacterium]
MADPYIGEIRMFGGNFAPVGWLMCQGQLAAISQYQALFNLIGTTYGGDGSTTFGIPDLQGRVANHQGTLTGGGTYALGQKAGSESITLTSQQVASHSHQVNATTAVGNVTQPGSNTLLAATPNAASVLYIPPAGAGPTPMDPKVIGSSTGGGQPHENRQPFLCISFIIATDGIYPTQ